MSVEVHMTEAGIGDCIWLGLGDNKDKLTILIDSGNSGTKFKETIDELKFAGRIPNYFILTHDDEDHLRGFYSLLKQLAGKKLLYEEEYGITDQKLIMNYGGRGESKLSAEQLHKMQEYLIPEIDLKNVEYILSDPIAADPDKLNIIQLLWKNVDGKLWTEKKYCHTFEKVPENIEHAEMVILSPNRASLKKYIRKNWEKINQKEVKLSQVGKIKTSYEWGHSIQYYVDHEYMHDIDNREANNSCISFLLVYKEHIMLFAGDANPNDMYNVGMKFVKQNGNSEGRILLDFMKMPHHGSSYNVTDPFLSLFYTDNYLISTSGSSYYQHPGKKMLASIARVHAEETSDKNINIFGNYPFWSKNDLFSEKEGWNVGQGICPLSTGKGRIVNLVFQKLTGKMIEIDNRGNDSVKLSL